ncbi:hypothetical protein MASR1M60_20480 [Rhodocyclaceae bacterium]
MGDTPMTSRLLTTLHELLTLARTEGGELCSVRAKIKLLEAGQFVPPGLQPVPAHLPKRRPQLYLVRTRPPLATTTPLTQSAR